MKPVFVDTSFLLALVLSDDQHHARAVRWQERTTARLTTTECVLVEFVDALSSATLREVAFQTVKLLQSDPLVALIPASTSLMNEGITLFHDRADKRWSLTDCIAFVAMAQAGIESALTSDHHFEQAGFRALLRHEPIG